MPNANDAAREALEHLRNGGFVMGDAWEKAHDICQSYEGVQIHDRIHALCHRIEGDHGNAAYWDRRGNQPTPDVPFDEECALLEAQL